MTATGYTAIKLTDPFLSSDAALWFSAHAFGWGYCAYAIPHSTVCEVLGAASLIESELLHAFESGKPLILRTVGRQVHPDRGRRIVLHTIDFIEGTHVID